MPNDVMSFADDSFGTSWIDTPLSGYPLYLLGSYGEKNDRQIFTAAGIKVLGDGTLSLEGSLDTKQWCYELTEAEVTEIVDAGGVIDYHGGSLSPTVERRIRLDTPSVSLILS